MLFHLANNGNPESAASLHRRRRVRKFAELVSAASRGVSILDVGGTGWFWERYRAELPGQPVITVLNRSLERQADFPWIRYVLGDARQMNIFEDAEFDFCFSNSVIEHVGAP